MREKRFFALLAIYLFVGLCSAGDQNSERRCGSLHFRYQTKKLRSFADGDINCTVIEGDLSVVMWLETDGSDNAHVVFPNLREITGYLLIYNHAKLKSVKAMFPELRVIGGESLIMNYALVVYNNPDLEDVGLEKLTLIKNGGVWITDNPKLCNTRHINWNAITSSPIAPVRNDEDEVLKNCRPLSCGRTKSPKNVECASFNASISCWTENSCQKKCIHTRNADRSVGPGCDPRGNRCHRLCVGGCERTNDPAACHSCLHVLQNDVCVAKCPDGEYELQNRRCVTARECHDLHPIEIGRKTTLHWKTVGKKCQYECPFGLEQNKLNVTECIKCDGQCQRVCASDFTINTLSDASDIHQCDVIKGNLVVNLGMNVLPTEQLEQAFGRVREVTGYIVIRFSSSFSSLDVFKNLNRIGGKRLYRDRYALSAFENPNLRKTFSKPLNISHGSVMFHNNRLLCYKEIVRFLGESNMTEITEYDVSSVSNGEKALCVRPNLNLSVLRAHTMSSQVILQFPNFDFSSSSAREFLGHQIFYREVKSRRTRLYREQEESCGGQWQMQFVPPLEGNITSRQEYIGDLKPNTLYAFYVKTRMTNRREQDFEISQIVYAKTKFEVPSAPVNLRAISKNSTHMELSWSPPMMPNGEITYYKVHWKIAREKESDGAENHCRNDASASQSRFAFSVGVAENNGTCPSIPGCCNCRDPEVKKPKTEPLDWDSIVRKRENSKMENQVMNLVYTVADRRRRRRNVLETLEAVVDLYSSDRHIEDHGVALVVDNSTEVYQVPEIATAGYINVSGIQLVIMNLSHFTNYFISVYACQDPSNAYSQCSKVAAHANIWTAPQPELDVVNASTVVYLDQELQNRSRLAWKLPSSPNGRILAFRLMFTMNDKDPIEYCVTMADYRLNEGALTRTFALEGDVSLAVYTVTTYGISAPSDTVYVHFAKRGSVTWLWVTFASVVMSLVLMVVIYITRGKRQKKMEKYPVFYPYETYKADEWEMAKDQFDAEKKLGHGSFGDVFLFRTKVPLRSHSGYDFTRCAGKVLRASENRFERDKFLAEGSMMKKFDSPFVVKLYGIVSMCTPPMVVMEYMENGNLRDYLRMNRPKGDGLIHMLKPSKKNLLWAAQIADGMAFLHSLNYCHRDLAARNVLVSANEVVKIGDFGLSRELGMHDYYRPDSARQLPIRWMAPEALQDGTSTIQSDVWSYAIVLYEILTYGSIPYVGYANEEVKRRVVLKRMSIELPGQVPKEWDALVKACAQYDSTVRPTFRQVVKYLKYKVRDPRFDHVSFVMNNDYQSVKSYPFRNYEHMNDEREENLPPSMNTLNIFCDGSEKGADEAELIRKANSLENVESAYFLCETDILLKDMATRAQSF